MTDEPTKVAKANKGKRFTSTLWIFDYVFCPHPPWWKRLLLLIGMAGIIFFAVDDQSVVLRISAGIVFLIFAICWWLWIGKASRNSANQPGDCGSISKK